MLCQVALQQHSMGRMLLSFKTACGNVQTAPSQVCLTSGEQGMFFIGPRPKLPMRCSCRSHGTVGAACMTTHMRVKTGQNNGTAQAHLEVERLRLKAGHLRALVEVAAAQDGDHVHAGVVVRGWVVAQEALVAGAAVQHCDRVLIPVLTRAQQNSSRTTSYQDIPCARCTARPAQRSTAIHTSPYTRLHPRSTHACEPLKSRTMPEMLLADNADLCGCSSPSQLVAHLDEGGV